MYPILFRGKSKSNGEWIYSNSIIQNENSTFFFPLCEVESSTVGRWTNLTDRKGRKMFEGDFVRVIIKLRGKNDVEEYVTSGVLMYDHMSELCLGEHKEGELRMKSIWKAIFEHDGYIAHEFLISRSVFDE